MSISIISAVAENNVIGINNELPWNLSADLKHFAQTTKGHTVLMGLNTFRSIVSKLGHPLPGRKNIVLSDQKYPDLNDCLVAASWNEAINQAPGEEIFVIGGANVYKQALPLADKLYLTIVHGNPTGDAYFPDFDKTVWTLTNTESHPKDEKNDYACSFNIYEKKLC